MTGQYRFVAYTRLRGAVSKAVYGVQKWVDYGLCSVIDAGGGTGDHWTSRDDRPLLQTMDGSDWSGWLQLVGQWSLAAVSELKR